MPSLQEILRDPNYINANEETKRAIFERHAPLDQNYTGANDATQAAIRQRFGIGQMGMPVAAPEQPTTGAFAAGVKSYLPQVQETFGGLKTLLGVGAERVLGEGQISRGLIESGAASMKEAEAKRQPFMTAERGSFTDALDKGVGAVLTEWLPYQAGSGAMQLLESLGLMGAGAIAGSALPGAGTLAGAGTGLVARELAKKGVKEAAEKILKEKGEDAAQAYFENEAKKAARKIGGTAAIGAQAAFYGTGQTTSRAVEEAEKLGGTATDIELARVLPAAAVSTVAEFIGDKIALGALKGIKPGEPGKFVAADLAKNILLNIGLTGTKEVPVEVIQSAAERFGAKLSLTDAQALKEYIDATAASYGMAVAPGVGGGVRQTMAERAKKPEAPAPEAPRTGPLTPEEQAELDRQRAAAERPKTTEELLAETAIQTGRPTTPEDITRIRDEHETAVIEGLLAQDVEMARANELAAQQREQQRQQLELESEAEATAGAISDIDTRVREGRIFARVQDLIDRNIPYASTAINDINQKFGVINEAPLTEEERARVENIMGMVNTFTNFVNLPVLAPKPVDQFAENQAMEALIKERTESGQAEPLRTTPVAPSPSVQKAPVSQGVGEGAAVRPTSGVEPSAPQDRQLVTAPVTPPAPPVEPAPVVEAAAPAEKPTFEPKIVSRQPAPDGMEVHVFTTTDGYGTGLFDADAQQYVNGSVTRFTGADTLPKAQERAAEMFQKATPPAERPAGETVVPVLSDFQKRLKDYWDNTATPAIRNYLSTINSFGIDRLEKSQIKPAGMSVREWLESFVSKQSTWDKGRKTGETGIQALSTKNLWPTTDGSGERLRKAMLDAVKALKNAPGSTSELVDQAFGESKSTTTAAPKADAPVTPVANVEEQTTPTEEAKDIAEPTIRNRLKAIAKNLGVLVFETGDKYSSGNGVVNIPTEDKQVEGAQSPEHVFAHELGHAILQNRSMSFNGMPNAEVAKWIDGWDGIKAISKAFRPEIHTHKLPKFRRHANKPDEIIADALGSFLLGNSSKQDIAPLIKTLNLNDFDLGIKERTSAAPAAPKAEAPAVEALTPAAEAPKAEPAKAALQVGGFRRATAREVNSDNAQFVYDVGNGARLLFVPSQNGDVYVAAPGKGASLVVRTGDNRDNVIKTVDQFPDYIPENIRQIVLDYHKAVQGKTTDEEQTAVAMEMAEKIEALTAPKAEAPAVEAPAAPPTLDTTGIKEVKGRHIQVQAAAKLLQDKKMTREEFEKYVDYYKPIQEVEADKLLPPTTEQKMNETVNADKRDRINVPVEDGTKVGLRMDLPARERGGSVVSIHEGKSGKLTVGKLMGFRSTGWLKDVTFEVRSQEKGLAVATGAAKAPQQTAEGTWQNLGPEETYARVKELMKDPAWKQIGFDPSRHGYFYDRKTREPVVSASEMYQVGQFLLAKDVKYAPKENYLYSVEPTIKSDSPPSFKRGAANLRRRWGEGEITSDEFANRASVIAKQVETAELSSKLTPNQRGAKYISQRLQEAKQKGELTKDAVDFAEWFILKNPKLVDDLAVSIESTNEIGLGGTYQVIERLMTLIKNGQSDYAIVHEMLHHLERMMPEDVRSAITKSWFKALVEAEKNAKTDAEVQFIKNIMDYHLGSGGRSALIKAVDSLKNGSVGISFYQYVDPSEFWAENGSKIMGDRFLMKGSVLKKLKQWLREFAEKAKDLFGLNSKAPIIRALDSLSKGDGKFVTDRMIYQGVEPKRNILQQEGEKTTPKDKATENFLRWFGDSKVVDRNGEPLVVYHGTKADISAFDMSRSKDAGVWFTPVAGAANMYAGQEAGANIIPAYVSLRNPYETKIGESRLDALMNAMDKGHDGIIVRDAKGNISTLAVFEPTQIKSAIGNNGDYSLTNPDIRKSIGGVSPGQQALETIRSMGMDVKPPEKGLFKRTWDAINGAGENPSLSKEELKKTITKFTDKIETSVFSTDAAFNNDLTRSVIKDINQQPEVLAMLLQASQSQTVNIDNVTSRALMIGSARHNKDMQKWEAIGTDEDGKKLTNFKDLGSKLEEIAKKYNISVEEAEQIGHTYLIAKRLPGIIRRNAELDAKITAEKATAKPDRKQIEEWDALKVYVSPTQEAMIEPGLSLVKTMPELSEIVDIQQGIRKNIVKPAVESGLWSQEYADAMLDNVDWVPFYRDEQLDAGGGPLQVIRGLQVKSKEFRLKGSDAAVANVFDNQFLWAQYLLSRAMRAQKARAMVDLAAKTKINGEPMAVKVTEEKRGMNIVRVFRDGKQELWDMKDPMYVDAFVGIQNVANSMFPWAAKLAEILRNSVILYPLFSVAQVPQDAFAAMFTSGLKPQYALRIPFLAVKEFIKTLNKTSATHKALINFGVVGARTFNADAMRNDAEIYAGVRPPKGGWAKFKDNLEHISMAGDNAVRQAVYEAAQQQGVSKPEAIEKAFEIFNVRRRGTNKLINLAGSTIPFFYAYLAAQRVAYRTITGAGTSPTQRLAALETLAYTSASVFALSMLYAMMVADDEDYQEMPTAVRDRTLTIPGSGGVRIPLRPDFFLFPKIVAEHTYLMITDQGYQDGAKFRKAMLEGLANAVSSPTPLPQIVKPSLEVLINYSFFDSKPIVGTFEKQKETARQFNDSTSEFAKLIGSTGVMSPLNIDYLVRGYFGSFGGLGLFMTNFLNSDPDVPRPELSWKEAAAALPGTSGFLKRPQESALKNDFYTLRDEVEKAVNTFNDIKTRSPQGMEDFLADEKQMARYMLGKPVDQISQRLSKIRRQMTIITNMPESQMSAEDKAENIRQLREFEREYLKSVDVKALREMAKI